MSPMVTGIELESTYHVVVSCSTKKSAERDDGRNAGEVEEYDGGYALKVNPVPVVTQHRLPVVSPLYVSDQSSEQSTRDLQGTR